MAIDGWYFEKLGVLTNEGELKEFFVDNYRFMKVRESDETPVHWCDGHISFDSKESLYDLVKICWRSSLKHKVLIDLKE